MIEKSKLKKGGTKILKEKEENAQKTKRGCTVTLATEKELKKLPVPKN